MCPAPRPAAGAPAIALEEVTKTFRMGDVEVHALDHVTFEVRQGEFVAITGPSGSGKSTALQLIGLLDKPTSGRLLVSGRRADRLGDRAQARFRARSIGFVFQYFHLYPTLSALDNVALPMAVVGVGVRPRRERAAQLLQTVGLESRLHHKPHELSGGQRQRVAIARAMANDPAIILADEPTGNLDTRTGEEVLDLLCQRHDEGTTLIVVTHDAEIAARADRIIALRDGRIDLG